MLYVKIFILSLLCWFQHDQYVQTKLYFFDHYHPIGVNTIFFFCKKVSRFFHL